MSEPLEPEARARIKRAASEIAVQAKRLPVSLALRFARAAAAAGVAEDSQAGDVLARAMAELQGELSGPSDTD